MRAEWVKGRTRNGVKDVNGGLEWGLLRGNARRKDASYTRGPRNKSENIARRRAGDEMQRGDRSWNELESGRVTLMYDRL